MIWRRAKQSHEAGFDNMAVTARQTRPQYTLVLLITNTRISHTAEFRLDSVSKGSANDSADVTFSVALPSRPLQAPFGGLGFIQPLFAVCKIFPALAVLVPKWVAVGQIWPPKA
jgi:hypothetical protein